jgi:hypothetical protein
LRVRWLIRLRRAAEPATVLHHPRRPIGLVFGVRATLDRQILFEAALGLDQPLGQRARHRPSVLGAPLVESRARVAQPPLPALARRQCRRQLVAAALAELLIFERVDLRRLVEERARDLLGVARRVREAFVFTFGAVDRDHTDPAPAQPQRTTEHCAEHARHRVIRSPVRADHARRDVLHTAPLDPPRRALADRTGVEQQREHHRRIVRAADRSRRRDRPPQTSPDPSPRRLDHKPRQMILRHSRTLGGKLTVAPDEVRRHTADRLRRRRRNPLCNSHHGKEERLRHGWAPGVWSS